MKIDIREIVIIVCLCVVVAVVTLFAVSYAALQKRVSRVEMWIVNDAITPKPTPTVTVQPTATPSGAIKKIELITPKTPVK